MALLPGMTANITIDVQKAENVLKAPAAALKFKPATTGRKPQGSVTMADSTRSGPGGFGRGGNRDQGDSVKSSGKHGALQDSASGRVFILTDGKLSRVPVKVGLSNGGFTAVEGELKPGDSVIVGVMSIDKNNTAAQQRSPFGGMGGRH
jgi:HlyD family secretion protein